MERVRFLDRMGFEQPVEAFSLLLPRGWKSEGGVRWLSPQQCRGDIVTTSVSGASADGSWQLRALPTQTWVAADDQMMSQILQAGANGGGCPVRRPVDARTLLLGDGPSDLGGATISNVRDNTDLLGLLGQLDNQANDLSSQYGTGITQRSSAVMADLSWPDGSKGQVRYSVIGSVLAKADYVYGGVSRTYTTMALERTWLRFPAAQQAEADRLFPTILASYRANPVWADAKQRYLTALGNAEHANNMARIKLMGEQSAEYARARSAEQDRQLRSWESGQDAQDSQHKQFVQAMREVETWNGGEGEVELSAGYGQAWSGGDGSYILSNSPSFDPNSAFRESNWSELKRGE